MGNYETFKEQIYKLTKIDLNSYKERQMKRRLDALIVKNGIKTYNDYIALITKNKDKLEEFITYMTINVSEFYRNPEQWVLLEKQIIPYLTDKFGSTIKIWSAACSTGDEPYSLVMLLSKFMPLNRIKIHATDIDKQILEKAKLGLYNAKSLQGLPKEFIPKYFTKINDNAYQISDKIKACVDFKQHDLLKDAYPTGCSMIVCRNVVIYFTEEAKRKIYENFNKALRPQGILFVGSTEQIIQPESLNFKTMKSFFYEKIV